MSPPRPTLTSRAPGLSAVQFLRTQRLRVVAECRRQDEDVSVAEHAQGVLDAHHAAGAGRASQLGSSAHAGHVEPQRSCHRAEARPDLPRPQDGQAPTRQLAARKALPLPALLRRIAFRGAPRQAQHGHHGELGDAVSSGAGGRDQSDSGCAEFVERCSFVASAVVLNPAQVGSGLHQPADLLGKPDEHVGPGQRLDPLGCDRARRERVAPGNGSVRHGHPVPHGLPQALHDKLRDQRCCHDDMDCVGRVAGDHGAPTHVACRVPTLVATTVVASRGKPVAPPSLRRPPPRSKPGAPRSGRNPPDPGGGRNARSA